MKIILLLSLLISLSLSAGEGPVLTKWSYEEIKEGTNAYHNLYQVKELLELLQDRPTANEIDLIFNRNAFYSINAKDFWDKPVNAEGYTHRHWKSIAFNTEFLSHNKSLDFLNSKEEFSKIVKLMFIYIHEYYHLLDYKKDVFFSTEKPVYESSFKHYFYLFGQVFSVYDYKVKTKSPDEKKWQTYFETFSSMLAKEFETYKNKSYGNMSIKFKPFFNHNGCVKEELNRKELALYLNQIPSAFNSEASFQTNMKEFDLLVRFKLPRLKNPPAKCLIAAEKAIVPLPDLPVGYRGPRLRQRILKINSIPKGNFLKIQKNGEKTNKANINIDVSVLGQFFPGNYPIPLTKMSTLHSWDKENSTLFDRDTNGVYIIITEKSENSFPDQLNISFSRTWSDQDGNYYETFIRATEIDPRMQWEFGFYPVEHRSISIPFYRNNARDQSFYWTPVNGVRTILRKGDYIRIKSKEFKGERRTLTLYRVGPEKTAQGNYVIKNVARMHNWQNVKNVSIEEDGVYYFLMNRDNGKLSNKFFRFDLDFSRNGTISPKKIQIDQLTERNLADIGFHVPVKNEIDFYIDWRTDIQSFDTSYFYPIKVFELDSRAGDRFIFTDLPQKREAGNSYLLKKNSNGELEKVKTAYSYNHSTVFDIETNEKYYYAFSYHKEFQNSFGLSASFVHYRNGGVIPSGRYRQVTFEELSKLNLFPISENVFSNESLTRSHPIGFNYNDMHFQIYRIEIKDSVAVRFQKNLDGVEKSNFYFTKINKNLFAQGLASFEKIVTGYSWNKYFYRVVEPGSYYLTVEGKIKDDKSSENIAWKMLIRSIVADPSKVSIIKLNNSQMRDQRLRLIQ